VGWNAPDSRLTHHRRRQELISASPSPIDAGTHRWNCHKKCKEPAGRRRYGNWPCAIRYQLRWSDPLLKLDQGKPLGWQRQGDLPARHGF
jgi:hypothetical protein